MRHDVVTLFRFITKSIPKPSNPNAIEQQDAA
jgi:hypothetical protein